MMRPRGSKAAALALLVALASTASPARAQVASDRAAAAEALFLEGRELVAQGRDAEACPKFEASQRLDPGYGTLWNLAGCLERIDRTASAWAALRAAADLARNAGQAERVKKAERRAAELEPHLTRLRVVVQDKIPGLEVRRDGALLVEGTWGTDLPVDPGRLRIVASAPDKERFSVVVETAGPGETVTVEIPPLEDAPEAPDPVVPPDSGSSSEGSGARRPLALAAGGVGLAGLAIGAIFGLRASSAWSEAQDEHCRTETLCDDEGVTLVDEAKTAATLSTVGFVVGGVGLAAGALLLLTASDDDAPPATTRVWIAPAVGATGGGLTLRGRF